MAGAREISQDEAPKMASVDPRPIVPEDAEPASEPESVSSGPNVLELEHTARFDPNQAQRLEAIAELKSLASGGELKGRAIATLRRLSKISDVEAAQAAQSAFQSAIERDDRG
jgi:hypothetical protein